MTDNESSFKFDVSKAKESFGSFANQEIPTRSELELAKSMVEDGDLEEEQYNQLKEAHESALEAEKDAFGV